MNRNELTFVALINEFCHDLERCEESGREAFVSAMIKILPRIYISAYDIEDNVSLGESVITSSLDEDTYDLVRNRVAVTMGEDDVYLEVFLDDMKYSDTPIATSVSENLADLYQEFFNLLVSIRDQLPTIQHELIRTCHEHFVDYWGQTLLNVLRAIHNIACADQLC